MPVEYLNNADLAAEIARCQVDMVVSDRLARMLFLLVKRIATKPSFRSYSFREDMEAEALMQLVRRNTAKQGKNDLRPNILKFDPQYAERRGIKPNPFSYASQIVMNVFRRAIRVERDVTMLRDDLLEIHRKLPSARRQIYNDENRSAEPIPKKPKSKAGRKKKVLGVAAVGSVG